jgi:hypothetical protein
MKTYGPGGWGGGKATGFLKVGSMRRPDICTLRPLYHLRETPRYLPVRKLGAK